MAGDVGKKLHLKKKHKVALVVLLQAQLERGRRFVTTTDLLLWLHWSGPGLMAKDKTGQFLS